MILRYTKPDGQTETVELAQASLTIGRSQDADIIIHDEKASRMHCAIRLENDRYLIKDLQSKNGTYVNGEVIEEAELSPGDRLRIGSTILSLAEMGTGTNTAILEVEEKMAEGKGYGTILKEIVRDVKPDRA